MQCSDGSDSSSVSLDFVDDALEEALNASGAKQSVGSETKDNLTEGRLVR